MLISVWSDKDGTDPRHVAIRGSFPWAVRRSTLAVFLALTAGTACRHRGADEPVQRHRAALVAGETGVGSLGDWGNGGLLLAQPVQLGAAGTLQSLSFYVESPAGSLRLGVYDATGPEGHPGAKLAETAELTPVAGWNTADVLAPVLLPPGRYWLAHLPSDSELQYRRTPDQPETCLFLPYAYGPLPATFGSAVTTCPDHWSFYATLTGPNPTVIGEPDLVSLDDWDNGDLLCGQLTSLQQPLVIQSLSFYITAVDGTLRMGIYDATGPDGDPGAKRAETAEITPVKGWNTVRVTTPVLLPPGNYWLAYLPSSENLHFLRAGGGGSVVWRTTSFGAMPSTFSPDPIPASDRNDDRWSFYATLTPPGAGGPDGGTCDDGNPCNGVEVCDESAVHPGTPPTLDDGNPCTIDSCDPATGVHHVVVPNGTACNDGNACTTGDSCQSGSCGGTAVTCLAQDLCHTAGVCDQASGACSNPAKADGTNCTDGDACTQSDTCQSGVCIGSNPVVCTAADQCHASGVCDSLTGVCSNPAKADGTACNDGSLCTATDSCVSGACVGGNPITCPAPDACHEVGTCAPSTGLCSNPPKPAGTSCGQNLVCSSLGQCGAPNAASFQEATAFLYEGANAAQQGVAPGAIDPQRAAVVRGRVLAVNGVPLAGVLVTIDGKSIYGRTQTRQDGVFDLAVSGGGKMTVSYQLAGHMTVHRSVEVPWHDFANVDDVVLTALDPVVSVVPLGTPGQQVAQGSTSTDADGSRTAVVMFPPVTGASMTLSDGTTAPLSTIHVRATEYTVGATGPRAMPASLPSTSGYTYAAEFSADEALAAGATMVTFNQPVSIYVENFLGFPVGGAVPVGFYDRTRAAWIASDNGQIIRIVGLANGRAVIDSDGNGLADTSLAIPDLELLELGSRYSVGRSLWRVQVDHFTPYDFNWPVLPPSDAVPPMPDPPRKKATDDPCSHQMAGSIIKCQSQALGETVPLTGTPFALHYSSNRLPDTKGATALEIPVTKGAVPASLKRIDVHIEIAGQATTISLPPASQGAYQFSWDGRDAYGRLWPGAAAVTTRVDYVYPLLYGQPRAALRRTFAEAPDGTTILLNRSSEEAVVTGSKWSETLRVPDTRSEGLGGWSFSSHHAYDPQTRTLRLGTGEEYQPAGIRVGSQTIAPYTSYPGVQGIVSAQWTVADVAVRPDGTVYLRGRPMGAPASAETIARVDPDGVLRPVTTEKFDPARGFRVTADGTIYLACPDYHRVERITPDGRVTTIAGLGTPGSPAQNNGFETEGLLATSSFSWNPVDVAVAPDGSILVSQSLDACVRRIGNEGRMRTVAGLCSFNGGRNDFAGDGGPATSARLRLPDRIDVGRDGAVYIVDQENHRIRRVGPDGIIQTVAGSAGTGADSGDGGPATSAVIRAISVALEPGGGFYIGTSFFPGKLRYVDSRGTITTVAGAGPNYVGSGTCATGCAAETAFVTGLSSVAVAPDGSVYVPASLQSLPPFIAKMSAFAPRGTQSEIRTNIASRDGADIYVFDATGRHLATKDPLTGVTRHQFGYDVAGRLASVTDVRGRVTTIEHDPAGTPVAIVAPGGERTQLAVDSNGFLSTITNPAGETIQLVSSAGGLLTRRIDAGGGIHDFTYDQFGRLISDEDPEGGVQSLSRLEGSTNVVVTHSDALLHQTRFETQPLATGGTRRLTTEPDSTVLTTVIDGSGNTSTTAPDGTQTEIKLTPAPVWGMQAPLAGVTTTRTPGGLVSTSVLQRSVALADSADPFSVQTSTTTTTVNGRAFAESYERDAAGGGAFTSTSPSGRSMVFRLDAGGRLVREEVNGFAARVVSYDAQGAPSTISEGDRGYEFAYNPGGRLSAITDPSGLVRTYQYDSTGRMTRYVRADGEVVEQTYDVDGRLTSVKPPGRLAHQLRYDARGLLAEYTPPDPSGVGAVRYSYNLDRTLSGVTRSDGKTIQLGYDGAGRLSSIVSPAGTTSLEYTSSSHLARVSSSDGNTIDFGYDGRLPTLRTWGGPVAGSVSQGYNSDFRIIQESVNGGSQVAFSYDPDGLMVNAGAMTLVRDPSHGMVTATTVGNSSEVFSYDGHRALVSYEARCNGAPLFHFEQLFDELRRVVDRSETVDGVVTVYHHTYDRAGRLTEVKRNGMLAATYTYDANGNRLTRSSPSGSETGAYDQQDRVLTYGRFTYTHSANGELERKTDVVTGTIATYDYDVFGGLRQVHLADGRVISYVLDPFDRRIGKRVNGVLVKRWLYSNSVDVAAEVDGAGAISRFVQGQYMTKGGTTYRIVRDHVGSVRLVVDVNTGVVAQRIEYDEFGRVLVDTNPGFQPFGFAGGLYDPDTGLVRFGARDYDAELGRWTTKDPIRFGGGDTNLYLYAAADPANLTDVNGLDVCAYQSSEGYHHEWVELGDDIARSYGRWPSGDGGRDLFGGPEEIRNPDIRAKEKKRKGTGRVCFQSTPQEESLLERWIRESHDLNEPSNRHMYFLGIQDCRHFVTDVLYKLAEIQQDFKPSQIGTPEGGVFDSPF
jgi:RHS repeat-associated protein